jgi:predicted helicase
MMTPSLFDLPSATGNKDWLVIVGNPPYNISSRTKTHGFLDEYKQIDGVPLGERNWRPLNDDYVKFIRFAQKKMGGVKEGIVALITNNGFLQNVTFRGMRASLLKTFDQIRILNLHGNYKKQRKNKSGGKDENVFDVTLGICITFFIKNAKLPKGVFYEEILGSRDEKYRYLLDNSLKNTSFKELKPDQKTYRFVPFQESNKYNSFYDLRDIFQIYNSGIKTGRDAVSIGFEKSELLARLNDLAHLPLEEARKKYNVGKDQRDWKLQLVQKDIKTHQPYPIRNMTYRPFDQRYIGYTGHKGLVARPSYSVMQHMLLLKDNVGIMTQRRNILKKSKHPFITQILSALNTSSAYDGSFLFPLYLYNKTSLSNEDEKVENFKPEFRKYINNLYQHFYAPEDIMGYIYGVMYSPFYNEKYKDSLSEEFARIPFVKSRRLFEEMSELGGQLIQVHLEKEVPSYGLGNFVSEGTGKVEKVFYDEGAEKLWINATQGFEKVPRSLIDFQIGSYPVVLKYLKSRKHRILTLEEISHVENVINILAFTLQQMEKIDEITPKIDP